MHRAFVSRKKEKSSVLKFLIPILMLVMIVSVVLVGVQNVSASASSERLMAMEQAVRRAVVQCYAIEGRYPSSIDYLKKNYGLLVDEERYNFHYQSNGVNMLPSIAVFARNV